MTRTDFTYSFKKQNTMGQMVKRTYIGAFIEVTSENFQELWCDEPFYTEVVEKNFLTAYQGLKQINVLIPISKDYSEMYTTGDGDEKEYIVIDFNPAGKLGAFMEDFKGLFEKIRDTFSDFHCRYGLVSFWDEIA